MADGANPDGRLLLFASAWDSSHAFNLGQAIYLPVGTPVGERGRYAWNRYDSVEYREIFDSFPQDELRVRTEPDLPYHHLVVLPDGTVDSPPWISDWVLLAHWHPRLRRREGMDVQWGIQRADLEARRFDRTFTTIYWNP